MLNWKAILIGAAVDFIGTIFVIMIFGHLWGGALQLGGLSGDSARDATANDPLFLAISMTIGWYFDYLAGKVAASIAGNNGPLHGVAAATPGVVLVLVDIFLSSGPQPIPAWFIIFSCGVSIGCAYYGGGKARVIKNP